MDSNKSIYFGTPLVEAARGEPARKAIGISFSKVPPSFCQHSPSAGLWRHGFYILSYWIPCIRTAAQCTAPKEREVPPGVLPVLQKIKIHSDIFHRHVFCPSLYSLYSYL